MNNFVNKLSSIWGQPNNPGKNTLPATSSMQIGLYNNNSQLASTLAKMFNNQPTSTFIKPPMFRNTPVTTFNSLQNALNYMFNHNNNKMTNNMTYMNSLFNLRDSNASKVMSKSISNSQNRMTL